jgi:hypothetical protein
MGAGGPPPCSIEVVHRELEQMECTEELGFDEIWLTEEQQRYRQRARWDR